MVATPTGTIIGFTRQEVSSPVLVLLLIGGAFVAGGGAIGRQMLDAEVDRALLGAFALNPFAWILMVYSILTIDNWKPQTFDNFIWWAVLAFLASFVFAITLACADAIGAAIVIVLTGVPMFIGIGQFWFMYRYGHPRSPTGETIPPSEYIQLAHMQFTVVRVATLLPFLIIVGSVVVRVVEAGWLSATPRRLTLAVLLPAAAVAGAFVVDAAIVSAPRRTPNATRPGQVLEALRVEEELTIRVSEMIDDGHELPGQHLIRTSQPLTRNGEALQIHTMFTNDGQHQTTDTALEFCQIAVDTGWSEEVEVLRVDGTTMVTSYLFGTSGVLCKPA
jgi:hypothetical protein